MNEMKAIALELLEQFRIFAQSDCLNRGRPDEAQSLLLIEKNVAEYKARIEAAAMIGD